MTSTAEVRQVSRTSCDTCRKLKIRCVKREDDTCMRCFEKGDVCFTTPMPKREVKPKRRERLEDIEERIQRMESILTSSLDTSAKTPQSVSTDTSLQDEMSCLFLSDKETSVYMGPSAGMSLFSPRGLEWLASKTGSLELTNLIRHRLEEVPSAMKACVPWQNKMMGQQTPFPPKETMDEMIDAYFSHLNVHVPIFSEEYFRSAYNQNPYPSPQESPSLYASISIVLTLICIMSDIGPQPCKAPIANGWNEKRDNARALGFLANCWSVFTQLCFSRGNILTVQALAGMGLALEVLLDPESSHITLGVAVRIAMGLGFHRKVELQRIEGFNSNQRQRMFWFLYAWDKSLSLRFGRAPYIHDDDIEIEEPEEEDLVETQGNTDSISFLYNIKLARIANKIYLHLYSGRSRRQSPQEYDRAIAQLDRELKAWSESLPIEKRPSPNFAQGTDLPSQMVLFLHLEYYNCLSMVHRARYYQAITVNSDEQTNETPQSTSDSPRTQLYDGHLRCLDAARGTARLFATFINSIQEPHANVICHLAYYPLSSYLVIFTNLINNPHDSYVEEDLALLRSIILCLTAPLCESGSPIGSLISSAFATLQSIAEKFHAQVQGGGWVNKKRSHLDEDTGSGSLNGGATNQRQRKEGSSKSQLSAQPDEDIFGLASSDTLRDTSNAHPWMNHVNSSSPNNTNAMNSALPGNGRPVPMFMPFIPWTLDWEFNHVDHTSANLSGQGPVNEESFWPGNIYSQFMADSFNNGNQRQPP